MTTAGSTAVINKPESILLVARLQRSIIVARGAVSITFEQACFDGAADTSNLPGCHKCNRMTHLIYMTTCMSSHHMLIASLLQLRCHSCRCSGLGAAESCLSVCAGVLQIPIAPLVVAKYRSYTAMKLQPQLRAVCLCRCGGAFGEAGGGWA